MLRRFKVKMEITARLSHTDNLIDTVLLIKYYLTKTSFICRLPFAVCVSDERLLYMAPFLRIIYALLWFFSRFPNCFRPVVPFDDECTIFLS